jgi:hypothetical protein
MKISIRSKNRTVLFSRLEPENRFSDFPFPSGEIRNFDGNAAPGDGLF